MSWSIALPRAWGFAIKSTLNIASAWVSSPATEVAADERELRPEPLAAGAEGVRRASATVTIIDAERIRHSGAGTVPDLLRSVPGVQVIRHSNGNFLISLRGAGGLTGSFLLLTLDGVPLNSAIDGSIDWDLLPLDLRDIERVEVVRGPVSAVYGGGAYAGAVHVISRRPSSKGHAAELRAVGGADLRPEPLAAAGANYSHLGEAGSFRWFVVGRHDDTANLGAGLDHPAGTQVGSLAALSVETGEDSRVILQLGGAWSRRGSLDHVTNEPLATQRALAHGLLAWRASELPSVLDTFEVWTRARARMIRAEGSSDPHGVSYDGTKALRGELGVNLGFDLHAKARAKLGAEGSMTWFDAAYLDPKVTGLPGVGFGATLGLDLFPTPRFDIRAQSRLQLPGLVATHRLAFIYHRPRWALRLAAASDERPPTALESAGRFLDPITQELVLQGNAKLDGPRHHSLELGAVLTPGPKLAVRPVVFAGAMTRAIVARFDLAPTRTFESEGSRRWLFGGELEVDWRVIAELSIAAGLGYLRFLETRPARAALVGDPPQNSNWTAALRLFGSTRDGRVGYGLGADLISGRRYSTLVGIPTVAFDVEVPLTAYADGRVEFQPARRVPLWLSLSARIGLPHGAVESFFPGAARSSSVLTLGVEWRRR